MKKSLIFYIIFAVYIGSTSTLFTYNIPKAAGIQPENTGNNNNKLSLHSLVQRGSPLLGNPSAPITVVEFGDFQCDRCARFAKATEPQLNQTYVQPGKVNLVYKYFPNYGPDSTTALLPPNVLIIKENSGITMTFYIKTKAWQTLAGLVKITSKSLVLK